MSEVTVAVVQGTPIMYDVVRNVSNACDIIAGHPAADLIVFPELYLSGYCVGRALEEVAQPLGGPAITALAVAACRYSTVVVCGFPERVGDRIANSAVVIDHRGQVLGSGHKLHLFADEHASFIAGRGLSVFPTRAGLLGLLICYDLEFPEQARALALAGADTLVVPTANMHPYAAHHAVYARARAMENGVNVLVANQVGHVGNHVMCGESRVVTPSGRMWTASPDLDEVLRVDVPVVSGKATDPNLDYLTRRRTDVYADLRIRPSRRAADVNDQLRAGSRFTGSPAPH